MCENWFFDQLPIGAAVMGKDGRFERINTVFCEATGYAADELLRMRLIDLLLPDDREEVGCTLRQLAEGWSDEACREVQFVGGDGEINWMRVLMRPARIGSGEDGCLLATVENITRRKRDERELIQAKEECERIFHTVPDPIAILDVDHRIVRVNQAMADRLECTRDEMVGRHCFEVVHGCDRPRGDCPHTCLLKDHAEHRQEVREEHLGGDFLISVSPLIDATGNLLGSIHVARDITERKQAEVALHKAYDTLEKRVEDRTRELDEVNWVLRKEIAERKKLEAEVLHAGTQEQRRMGEELHDELGQELTGLRYLASSLSRRLIAMDIPEGETAMELAAGIGHALQRTRAIVRGLLPVEIDARNLVPALESLAADIQERFEIVCRVFHRGQLPIEEDHAAIQLYRIAQGAVNNAVKHGQADRIDIQFQVDGDGTILRISDDGVGIPAKVKTGSGSGLQIMRYRAGAIGGTFEVEQGNTSGTVVTCVLNQEGSDGCQRQTEIRHA